MRIGSNLSNIQNFGVEEAQLEQQIIGEINGGTTSPTTASSGGGQPPAATSPESYTSIPNPDSMPDYYQGSSNGCGTTSLAMIMTYLGVPTTQQDADNAIRRTFCFSSPEDLLNYARSKGLDAEGYNHGSDSDIQKYVNQGLPVQILVTADGSGSISEMHYVDVVGYGTDANGNTYYTVHNSATGKTEQWSQQELDQKWGNTPLGFDHYYSVYGPQGSNLPPSNFDGIQGTIAGAEGIANVMNGADSLIQPNNVGDFVHGLFQVPAGIIGGLGGIIGGGIQMGANWVKNELKNIPGLNIISSPLMDLFNGAGAICGDFFGGIGNTVNDFGSAVGDLFQGNFSQAAGDAWQGVKDAASTVSNVASDVGNTVSSAVSDVGNAVSSTISDIGSLL